MSTNPEQLAAAQADFRRLLESVRLADTHQQRIEALGLAQGNLFMLWRIEWIEREMFDVLHRELLQANADGMCSCEAT
ncbi:hypothetical protein [Pseudomonas viridiflava]|uniref:hypothetical protein n=1 Tax=Pseudomonas viridiflava TaxID=33069 RepID=UPI000F035FFD|nr:hypothetical protein [Pseudomonas viridiflava]MEE4124020.1 hypothetical protein [Pseudomonas viridiflava]